MENTAVKKYSFKKDLPVFITQLRDIWELGPKSNQKKQCSDITVTYEKFNKEFWQCNPIYIDCLLKQKNSILRDEQGRNISYESSKTFMRRGDLILRFVDKNSEQHFSVKLEKFCHRSFLPQRIYSTGRSQQENYLWDNFGQDIFVDKFYITNFDVSLAKDKRVVIKHESDLPALALNISEQKEYCHSQGGSLLQAHVFDAVAFYPSVYSDGYLFKSKYPWGKKSLIETKCSRIYSKECVGEESSFYSSVGWTGVFNILGGELESLENIFKSNSNLKVSSKYLAFDHFWQQNARRASWDGEGFESKNFDFRDTETGRSSFVDGVKGVAFRCMYLK